MSAYTSEQEIPQMATEAGATDKLKIANPLRWVSMMKAIKIQAEEILWTGIVYRCESNGHRNVAFFSFSI